MDYSSNEEKVQIEKALKDLDDFIPLYKHYQRKIYNYCLYRLPTVEDAQDTTSQVFVNALNAFANKKFQLDSEFSFRTWLFRIAHNLVVDYYREKSRPEVIEIDDSIADDEQVYAEIEKKLDVERSMDKVEIILKRFDDYTQSIFVLKFREDMTFEEISWTLDLDQSTVKMKYYRALQLIKRIFNSEGNY